MGLFSIFRKNKQESASDGSEFLSRAEDESNSMRGRGKRKQRKPANEAVDPALPQKKRARRRLVGAIALVLAAIIVLPMILDSEPKPLAEDIAIQIPSKDGSVPRTASASPAQSVSAARRTASIAGLDDDEELIQQEAAPAVAERSATKAAPSPDKPPKSELEPKPAPKVEDKVSAQPIPSRKPDESERARAILEGKAYAEAKSTTSVTEVKPVRYVVQVAALSSKDKVSELQSKLKSAGIKSYTQKVATVNGDRIRIRVGPFPNRDEADRMRAKIGKLGLNGTLVPA